MQIKPYISVNIDLQSGSKLSLFSGGSVMRLQIRCQDRVGLVKEVLHILVEYQVDLRGIEVDQVNRCVYIAFPQIPYGSFQQLISDLGTIEGVEKVNVTRFLPNEREHKELVALLKLLPDGVLSIDTQGNIVTANQSALDDLSRTEEEVLGQPIRSLVNGFDFQRWFESNELKAKTVKVTANNQEFISDILPINVVDEERQNQMMGAVINLRSQGRLGQQLEALQEEKSGSFSKVLTESSAMRRLVKEAKKMAVLDAPMLIQGETGTGKELIARACHDISERNAKPFLVLNCASIPDDVAESELFGYGENALIGAGKESKRGIFEVAEGGTVFLDEVGEMSPDLQTKLLRIIQDGTFRRVADENEIKVDVKIICSTQKDLAKLVQDSGFREDLFYRLNVLSIRIPSLRERKQDILPLTKQFLSAFCRELGKENVSISKVCSDYIQNYPWPGNVRQLENGIYRAVSLLEGTVLEQDMLELPNYSNELGYSEQDFEGTLDESVKRFEAKLLRKLYPQYPSSRQLGKRLGVSHTAIANKLRDYGINKNSIKK